MHFTTIIQFRYESAREEKVNEFTFGSTEPGTAIA